jgi:MFS family permease
MRSERWNLVWMCVLVGLNQLGFGGVLPALPLYARSFGVSASAIGLAVGIYGLARLAGAAPAGALADRLGRRPALLLGGLLTSAGNLWCALAHSYPEFIVARFVAGAGSSFILTTGQIVLADITTPERRGRVISIYMGVFLLGVGIGPLPGGLLSSAYGLAAPFLAFAAAGLGAGLVGWFAVGETRPSDHPRLHRGGGPAFLGQASGLLRHPGFALACLVSLTNAVARTGGIFAIVPVIGAVRLGLDVSHIGFALAAGTVASLLASYPGGWLTDRFGRKSVIAPATVLSGIAMLLFSFAPSYLWFIAASLVWSTSTSIGGSAPQVYAADVAPPGMNAATIAVYRMVGDLGYVAGPLAMGLIADGTGPVAALAVAAVLLVASGGLFAAFAPETYRRRPTR